MRRALQRRQDPRLPAPLHRRGGGRGRRDARAGAPRTRSSRPTASTATRWRAACSAGAIMAEMYGKVEGCSRGRGGSMHLFDAATALLRRQRHRRRRPAARRRPGAGRQDAGARRASPPASSATARWPRASSTSRMNLAALWKLPVLFCCENNLYAMGTALGALGVGDRPGAQGRQLRHAGVAGRRHGRARRRRPPRRAAAIAVRAGGGPYFLELRTYRFRAHSMFDPELLPQQGGGRGLEAARSDRRLRRRAARSRAASTTPGLAAHRGGGRGGGRRARSPSPRPGTWSRSRT